MPMMFYIHIYIYTHTHTVKKDTESLLVAIKAIGLEVNADKTKYLVMS